MAYVKVVGRAGPSDLLRVCFFVSSGVGRGQANGRDDTLLVQFFLNKIWRKVQKGESYGIPGKPPLAIDGVCGNDTIEAIKRFQSVFYREFGSVVIHDGVVNAQQLGQPLGPRHQQVYTIAALNYTFADEYGTERHMLILNEPGFPNELLYKLFS